MLLTILACASDDVAWGVHHASVVPSETGLSGTQTWEFFDGQWADSRDEKDFVCARAQTLLGEPVAAPQGCTGCTVAYAVVADELGGDCEGALADDESYLTAVATIGFGDVSDALADLDPYPGRSLGWYASFDGEKADAYGFAYVEGLDWQGDRGSPGWVPGQTYTLWPAYAWDLR
ncbi:MAG: hypothetical protein ACOZNI_35215 [Myxococcota bacterium]